MTLAIRPMQPADLDAALDWAAAEGWNPGLQDAACFAGVDPAGRLVATLDGERVGCITVVNYDAAFAFLGCYIVRPDYRGRGYGLALWQAGMAHAGKRLVGLDGVVAQQPNYRKSGFVYAHRNLRYAGRPQPARTPDLVRLDTTHLEAVAALDRTVFPAPRDTFWQDWLTAPGHVARGLVDNGRLLAFGVLRPCRKGAKIGPLVATTRAQAETVLDGLLAAAPTGDVFLDVPATNPAATALAEGRGMAPMFETARMYTGPAPTLDIGRIYGITTFELG